MAIPIAWGGNFYWTDKSAGDDLRNFFEKSRIPHAFASDNLITVGKILSFLGDDRFMAAFTRASDQEIEQAIIWRRYIQCWFAKNAMRLDGDFVECGAYKGTAPDIIYEYCEMEQSNKSYYLYDLFEWREGLPNHPMNDHGPELHAKVCERFTGKDKVKVIKGLIPESFSQGVPEKIAFMHVDMNSAEAEIAALNGLWDRMVPGAYLILDDYGWTPYAAQKKAEDVFFANLGLSVLELPTGQGLVIKP